MGKHLVDGMPPDPETGDVYFDISDGKIKVPGEAGIHEFGGGSFQPYWYGWVSSTGVATRLGGTGTVSVRSSNTGIYTVTGAGTRTVMVSPLYRYSGSIAVSPLGCSAMVMQNNLGSVSVRTYRLDGGTLTACAFTMLIL